jgi:hypothetical protein
MGFQETVHSLPHALSYAGIALGNGTRLDVMVAEIGKVWVGWGDTKDGGDVLVGVSVKVPRRQLIDYHGDLYPDIQGTSESEANFVLEVLIHFAQSTETKRTGMVGRCRHGARDDLSRSISA